MGRAVEAFRMKSGAISALVAEEGLSRAALQRQRRLDQATLADLLDEEGTRCWRHQPFGFGHRQLEPVHVPVAEDEGALATLIARDLRISRDRQHGVGCRPVARRETPDPGKVEQVPIFQPDAVPAVICGRRETQRPGPGSGAMGTAGPPIGRSSRAVRLATATRIRRQARQARACGRADRVG